MGVVLLVLVVVTVGLGDDVGGVVVVLVVDGNVVVVGSVTGSPGVVHAAATRTTAISRRLTPG